MSGPMSGYYKEPTLYSYMKERIKTVYFYTVMSDEYDLKQDYPTLL